MDLCDEIYPFPPGYYYDGEKFVCYHDATTVQKMRTDDFARQPARCAKNWLKPFASAKL